MKNYVFTGLVRGIVPFVCRAAQFIFVNPRIKIRDFVHVLIDRILKIKSQ